MPTLQQLRALINENRTVDQAVELVRGTGGIYSQYQNENDIRNCSGMQGWVWARWSGEAGSLMERYMKPDGLQQVQASAPLEYTSEASDFFIGEAKSGDANHNVVVIREGDDYALFQAWDGHFHLFPALNGALQEGSSLPNVSGSGENGKDAIHRMLTSGMTVGPTALAMPEQWDMKLWKRKEVEQPAPSGCCVIM